MPLIDTLHKLQSVRKELQGLIEKAAIMFVDLADSTYYKDAKGVQLGVEKIVSFNLDVTEIIKEKGEEYKNNGDIEEYEISKYIGDEVMSYFKGKHCAKAAAETAVQIQRHFKEINRRSREELEKFKPKIGIDYGEVLFAQYYKSSPLDPHGLVVDRAARIISLAKPYQILISDDLKKLVENHTSAQISEGESRKLKGIKDGIVISEVIWDEALGELGIKREEEPQVHLVGAEEQAVFRFIESNNLLENSKQIDLFLYTYETLAIALRGKMPKLANPILIRCILRNPSKDSRKEANIKTSISKMVGVMRDNPNILFRVRFYDDEPLLRTYIFHKSNNETEGLLGLYKWDPTPFDELHFVGAEGNQLINTRGRSFFEKHLLNLFQSRFDYIWRKLSVQKAVIFDLDGVLIDSMPFHCQAWREAFAKVHINISDDEVYEREGEKREITAREIYMKHKDGEEPIPALIDIIIGTKEDVFNRIFELQVFPGVLELLTVLKSKNVKLAIVTGSSSLKMDQHKSLFDLFDVIVSGEDTDTGKPNPDPYLKALQKLDTSSEHCYVIENAPLGIRAAVASNLTCFAVKGNSPLPEDILKAAGAFRVYKNIEQLREHIVWVDTNMSIPRFLDIFGSVF